MPHVLLVDDHPGTITALTGLVSLEGYSSEAATSLAEARTRLAGPLPDVMLVDVYLPDGNGLSLLDEFAPDTAPAMVLMTGKASVASAVDALRRGARDYLTKPLDLERLRRVLREVGPSAHASSRTRGRRSIGTPRLIGQSPQIRLLRERLARVAATGASVLLTGESGTGKDLAAHALHEASLRRDGPFIAVNCGAMPPTLLHTELFGHERGSFTGADRRHRGVFELANGGTLFLDEITEMPPELQVSLLRVLENGEFLRVGGEAAVGVDVRVVAATNREPLQAIRDGRLREDLYYRLRTVELQMPSLRERRDDIALLADHFLAEISAAEGLPSPTLSDDARTQLMACGWPGNVRQLRNALYCAAILADEVITAECLPPDIAAPAGQRRGPGPAIPISVGMSVADSERRLIEATLAHERGNRMRAAAVLGISLKTLYNRLQGYAASDDDPRPN
jgi:two-component system response regulator AtoC